MGYQCSHWYINAFIGIRPKRWGRIPAFSLVHEWFHWLIKVLNGIRHQRWGRIQICFIGSSMLFMALSMFSLASAPSAGVGYPRIATSKLCDFIYFGHWISSVLGPGPLGTDLGLLATPFVRAGYALLWINLAGSYFGSWPTWDRFGFVRPPILGPGPLGTDLGLFATRFVRAGYAHLRMAHLEKSGWPTWP